MSLVKNPEMTGKNRAAHGRNGRKSRGAATPEGKERSRAANLRHGIYSKMRGEALTALGEDPAELAVLIEGGYEQWRPANASQAQIVERLARLQWRLDRAERMQDNLAAQQVEKVAEDRREKTMPLRYRYVDQTGVLASLRQDGLRPDFYAPLGYIQMFAKAFATDMNARAVEILELLHRLREPQQLPPGEGPLPPEATNDRDWEGTLDLMAELEQDEGVPRPDLPVAEAAAERAQLREDLRALATAEKAAVEAVWDPFFAKYMQPLTTAERDQAVAEWDRQLDSLRRHEEACFRQFWRLTTLLMKIQDRAAKEESGVRSPESGVGSAQSEVWRPESEVESDEVGAPHGVPVQTEGREASSWEEGAWGEAAKGVGPHGVRPAASGGSNESKAAQRGLRTEVGPHGVRPQVHTQRQNAGLRNQDSVARDHGTVDEIARKNAGAPGDVEENKGGAKSREVTECPAPAARAGEQAAPLRAELLNTGSNPGSAARNAASAAAKAAA